MALTWHLIKYVADPRRREPRNVGLVLQAEGRSIVRFVGEDENGHVDGRQVRGLNLQVDAYRTWIDYYRRKARSGSWEDVDRLERRGRVKNFYTEIGGMRFDEDVRLDSFFDELFRELVAVERPVREPRVTPLETGIEEVLAIAGISPTRHITVPGRYKPDGTLTEVSFEMGYTNGQLHLLDQVPATPQQGPIFARDLLSRVTAARNAGSARSFLAFYSSTQAEQGSADLDEVLLPLEGAALTVDVDDRDEAVSTLQHVLSI